MNGWRMTGRGEEGEKKKWAERWKLAGASGRTKGKDGGRVKGRKRAMGILGEDGDGYELAVRLENSAVWREWLGPASYAKLLPHLSSPAAWHFFMNSSTHLTLQMRVRALLFDRAATCLATDDAHTFRSITPISLHPSYLQLEARGVYFSLDQDAEDWKRLQAEGSTVISNVLVKHGLSPLDSSTGNGEDGHDAKGAPVITQQRCSPQAGQNFSNSTNPKQEVSRPSLNKVKKLEAWDNFDAKRPMEVVGTINKKLRSPKISSKPSFQGDLTLISATRDHFSDKVSNTKSSPGSALILEEPKYSAIGAERAGHTESAESGRLWYDRCLEKQLAVRMHRVAHRTAQQKVPFKDQDACVRTAEGMAAYIDKYSSRSGKLPILRSNADFNARINYSTQKFAVKDNSKAKEDSVLMPEFKYLGNCVPDNPIPAKRRRLDNHQTECRGVLDQLEPRAGNSDPVVRGCHTVLSKERPMPQMDPDTASKHELDLLSGSIKLAQGSNMVQEDANQMMQQAVAEIFAGAGFEGLKQSSMDIISDLLGCHIRKLGSGLRMFVDNYRKRCSQTELLKMFMQSTGYSVEDLMEHVKAGLEVGSQVGTQVGSQVLLQATNQRRRTTSAQLPIQQVSPGQSPSPLGPLQQAQQNFSDKALKRRQLSNLGRSKKVEKDRPVVDGKFANEARSDVSRTMREMKPMQISPRLHPQQAPWHPQIPLGQFQPGPALQNLKQQLSSSLQQ